MARRFQISRSRWDSSSEGTTSNHATHRSIQPADLALIPLLVIFEEWLSRGVVLRKLLRFGVALALIVSSAMFAAFHLSTVNLLPSFIGGLIFGLLYLRTRSLWAPITAHLSYNCLAFAFLFLRSHIFSR